MALTEGQVSIRGVIMGPGTKFRMMDEFNPFEVQVRAEGSGSRAWGHGGWSGAEWAEPRVVPMQILIRDEADLSTAGWMAARHQLAAAFRPIGDNIAEVECRFVLGGREYVLFGRPRMLAAQTQTIGLGHGFANGAFVALNPFIYAGAETAVGPITLPTYSGGLTFPMTLPFTIDAVQSGGFADLTNEGTAEVGLLLRIDGPLDEPWVTLDVDGTPQTLRFNTNLTSGQWLDVDTAARTVLLNGVTSFRGKASGTWPILPAGTHRLDFRAASGSGELAIRWRSAWW